jgi:hypothetical protein
MAVSFWVASVIVRVCLGVPPWDIGAWIRALPVRELVANKTNNCAGTPSYSPDLAHNDFLLFPKIKKKYWKEDILMTLMTPGVIRLKQWRTFHKTSSKIVLKGELGAGIDAYFPKWNALKATAVTFGNDVWSNFNRDEFANFIVRPRTQFVPAPTDMNAEFRNRFRDFMDCTGCLSSAWTGSWYSVQWIDKERMNSCCLTSLYCSRICLEWLSINMRNNTGAAVPVMSRFTEPNYWNQYVQFPITVLSNVLRRKYVTWLNTAEDSVCIGCDEWQIHDRTGWSRYNALQVYSRGSLFESRPRQHLPW